MERAHRLHSNKDSDNEEEEGVDEQGGELSNKKVKEDLKLKQKRVSLYTKLSLAVNLVSIPIEIN